MTRQGSPNIPPEGAVGLLVAILRRAPSLPRALCRDAPEVFDLPNGTRQDIDRARQICAVCPELGPCAEWVRRQPRANLSGVGVVAGKWYGSKTEGAENDNA